MTKANGAASKALAPPLDETDSDKEIDRLAKLNALAYARSRAASAETIGIPVSMLDKLVKARQREAERPAETIGQGRPIEIVEVKPWHEAVDGAVVLDALVESLLFYVVMTDKQADAVALWTAHSHAHEACETSPKLVLKSPQKRSGKTRLVEALSRTTNRTLTISGISPAALLRLIEMHRPTLLLDEMDAAMKRDREMAEALRGLINSGFDRAAARYVMNVPTPDGGYEPRSFSTWCPQLLSGIGNLPDTIRDRSIEIDMQRKPRAQKVKRLRRKDGDELHEIARKLARWSGDNMVALSRAEPPIPAGLNDRAADAWESLFAIADLVGGGWPKRARDAALALSGDNAIEDEEIGSMLLADIREIFAPRIEGHTSSADLTEALAGMKDRPWADWRGGKAITQHALARLLKPYRIAPTKIRIDDDRTLNGYRRTDFEDAFTRYLSPHPLSNRNNRNTAAAQGFPADSEPEHASPLFHSENGEKPNNDGLCSGVPLQPSLGRQEHDKWTV